MVILHRSCIGIIKFRGLEKPVPMFMRGGFIYGKSIFKAALHTNLYRHYSAVQVLFISFVRTCIKVDDKKL